MKLNYFVPVLILSLALVMVSAKPAMSQCSGGVCTPPPTTTVVTSDGAELEVSYYDRAESTVTGTQIRIVGDGFSVSINYMDMNDGQVRFSINNSDNPYDWGPGIIHLDSNFGLYTNDEVLDFSVLPPEYLALWDKLRAIAVELKDNEEMWALIGDESPEMNEFIKGEFQRLIDGYVAPSLYDVGFSIQEFICTDYDLDGRLGRGYGLFGPTELRMMTASPYGDENPKISLSLMEDEWADRWAFEINPETMKTQVTWEGVDASRPIELDECRPAIENVRNAAMDYLDQVNYLLDHGFMTENTELIRMLEICIEGLDSYEFEVVYRTTGYRTFL